MKKRMFISLGVLVVLIVLLNLAIGVTSKTSQRRHMLATLDQIPESTDCIFLGNSLVEAGCDVTAFKDAWPAENAPITPVNLALGATTPVEHYLILQKALQKPLKLKFLVYGFFDDQLNAAPQGRWSDLVGNRAFSYYFPVKAASFYAPGSALKKGELWMTGHIPMLADRSSLWGKVELLRRRMEEVGMPKQKVNRFGRVDDFAGLEASDVESFTHRCHMVTQQSRGFSTPIQEIIALAQAHGARVILVEMPLPSRHRNTFYSTSAWHELRSHLESLAANDHVTYLSAGDWVKDDRKFEDATHLNEDGAKVFSGLLSPAVFRLTQENR